MTRLALRTMLFTVGLSSPVVLAAQTVHQLPATPTTVAYGYYWSEANPAVRIKSGDIVEIETMLTNTPRGLEAMGVKPEDIPQNLRDIGERGAATGLYIVVFVRGALLEMGDGHAAQGAGEVDQTAIETNLKGRVQLIVRKDMKLEWPRGETPTHWITMGTDTSLVVATKTAIGQMVKFLQETKGITRTQAYQAASMAADLHITQLVDGNVGVHMMIAKSYLR